MSDVIILCSLRNCKFSTLFHNSSPLTTSSEYVHTLPNGCGCVKISPTRGLPLKPQNILAFSIQVVHLLVSSGVIATKTYEDMRVCPLHGFGVQNINIFGETFRLKNRIDLLLQCLHERVFYT